MRFLACVVVALACLGCQPPSRVSEEVTIVNVYDEERMGDEDGTTIVAFADGQRARLRGKLGSVGDKISVRMRYENGDFFN